MEPFYRLGNLNAKMLSGALLVLALALFIPFSTYLTQQRNSTTSQAGSQAQVAPTTIILNHHQFDCSIGDPQNGIPAGSGCNDIMVGKTFAIDVQIRSDIDASNLVNAELTFPNKLMSVQKVITQGSNSGAPTGTSAKVATDYFISSWVNRDYNNENGEIQLVGAVPAPGFITLKNNPPALMARIYFKALSKGDPEIIIDDKSAIYRNVDNANIIGETKNYSLTIN